MSLPRWLQRVLEHPLLARIRRNHALEHATLHVLGRRFPHLSFAGYSDASGFWLWADLPIEEIARAAEEALQRLRAGEREMAVHPGCGTNYLVMSLLAALTAMGFLRATERRLRWWDRFSLLVPLLMLTLLVAQPMGHWLQAMVTTSPDLEDMEITFIRAMSRGGHRVYRVDTVWKPRAPVASER